jgi:hypothetical protein
VPSELIAADFLKRAEDGTGRLSFCRANERGVAFGISGDVVAVPSGQKGSQSCLSFL